MQPGDVPATFADVSDLARDVDFKPSTSIEVGVRRFVDWYLNYYKAKNSVKDFSSQPKQSQEQDYDYVRS
jgi:dTDP-D-glucose 4,6-dehydratase